MFFICCPNDRQLRQLIHPKRTQVSCIDAVGITLFVEPLRGMIRWFDAGCSNRILVLPTAAAAAAAAIVEVRW